MFARDKHSGSLGPFVSYEENEVLWTRFLDNFPFRTELLKAKGQLNVEEIKPAGNEADGGHHKKNGRNTSLDIPTECLFYI